MLKLNQFQVNNGVIKWIECFLSNRSQKVSIRRTEPRIINSHIGSIVPQGSILGSLLCIYINCIPIAISERTSLTIFADDSFFYRKFKKPSRYCYLMKDVKSRDYPILSPKNIMRLHKQNKNPIIDNYSTHNLTRLEYRSKEF